MKDGGRRLLGEEKEASVGRGALEPRKALGFSFLLQCKAYGGNLSGLWGGSIEP